MSCWDVLGIEPTRHRSEIDEAFEVQRKFVSGDEQKVLEDAYRQALKECGVSNPTPAHRHDESVATAESQFAPESEEDRPRLSAKEQQIARETVIQVRAMLNDSARAQDPSVWRAILAEPPADEEAMRQQIGRELEQDVRPLAENGAFPSDVVRYLGDWFGWDSLPMQTPEVPHDTARIESAQRPDSHDSEREQEQASSPKMTNFWPAVIGWIIALVVLTSFFSGMGGGS
ncbi:J domain-containing protein [Marinobacter caseinilyticus]|uniref:J domain-containing protein n=1 Tax=Marinobacter caseinilyticus TaxID=2692195 RepID=UPI00140CD37E|nr:J domain-containing protein [Marinobacter caseinilyticus]